jgi:hypothetical protein
VLEPAALLYIWKLYGQGACILPSSTANGLQHGRIEAIVEAIIDAIIESNAG